MSVINRVRFVLAIAAIMSAGACTSSALRPSPTTVTASTLCADLTRINTDLTSGKLTASQTLADLHQAAADFDVVHSAAAASKVRLDINTNLVADANTVIETYLLANCPTPNP